MSNVNSPHLVMVFDERMTKMLFTELRTHKLSTV